MRALYAFPLALALGAGFAACDTSPGATLFDEVEEGTRPLRPDPSLTGMVPVDGEPLIDGKPVAGLTMMALTGTNFNPSPESTFVYVAGQRVPFTSITETQITLRAPNVPLDNLPVKVSVLRAPNFTEPRMLSLASAFVRWGQLGPTNTPLGIATDPANATGYVSLNVGAASDGIHRVTGTARSEKAVTSTFQWTEMAYAANHVYTVRGVQAVFRFPATGGPQEVWSNLADPLLRLRALDVDAEGNVWTGGEYTGTNAARRAFFRITPAKVVTVIPFEGEVRAIEVAGGYVYVGGVRGGATVIWRYPVSGAAVGAEEEVARFTGAYEGAALNALAATTGGDLLVGTSHTDPLLRVRADRTVEPHLPGLLSGTITAIRWLGGSKLLVSGARIVGDSESGKTANGDLVLAETFLNGAP